MRPTHHQRHPARRRGIAIAELLVAATLLVVGVLALVGTTSQLARADTDGRRSASAASLIAERLERSAGSPCRDSTGARLVRGLDEQWRTTRAGATLRVIDTVRWTTPDGARVVGVDGGVRCLP